MSRIVFVLSEDASARIRAYCEEHGSDLDGLASDAVSCLLDVLSDDYGGPWMPSPCGLATGHDLHSESIAAGSTIWKAAQDEADVVRTMLDLRAQGMTLRDVVAELDRIECRNDGDLTDRELGQYSQALQDAKSEAEASREICAVLRRDATGLTDVEREIMAAVVEARAAGLSIRAIVAELDAASTRPAKKGDK